MGKFGQFSSDAEAYDVGTTHTPRDWVNFFWNDRYLACAAQNLNGFSRYQSPAGCVTNLFGKQDERESPRGVYLKDRATGEVWSAGYHPCRKEPDEFSCRHGLGFSRLESSYTGVQVSVRLFVPRHWPGEIWTVEITNPTKRIRDLALFCATEVALDGVNFPYGYISGLQAEYLAADRLLYFRNTAHVVANEQYRAFWASDRHWRRWDVSRAEFLGPDRDWAAPMGVARGRLGNQAAAAEPLVGAVQYGVRLAPGRTWRVNLVMGVVRDLPEARRMRKALADDARIEREFDAVVAARRKALGGLRVRTPKKDFDSVVNVWLKHQLNLMADWARFYFKGFRDTCQDAAGLAVLDPTRAWKLLEAAFSQQRSDGYCPRAFRTPGKDVANAERHYADSPTWLSHATDVLLRETGDLSLLTRKAPYIDGGMGTVLEHNQRAVEFLWRDRGRHGLSLLHDGDWNDLLDQAGAAGQGEGVWLSCAVARVLRLNAAWARQMGETARARQYDRRYRDLARAIHRHGWDGRYFLYAINDAGEPVGSHRCREGRMFINPQSWALLSGVIDAAAYRRIMKTIEPHVETPVGPVHHWPPYTEYDPGIGQLSGTPPGFFTNGNVYCHAASFKIAADFDAGRTDKAFDTLMRIWPDAARSEPFAQANGYVGPTAQRRRRHVSDDPWRTGTVAWHWLNISERLLGFRTEWGGVRFQPCWPTLWNRGYYERPFRGTLFEVDVRRGTPEGVWVDGERLPDNYLAVPPEGLGRRVRVEIRLPRATAQKTHQ